MNKIYYSNEFFKQFFKFDESAKNEIIKFNKKDQEINELFKKFKSLRKKDIPEQTIIIFYENPGKFFNEYQKLLANTSLLDSSGNSIFEHYFYVLYENYNIKNNRAKTSNMNAQNINFNIYESNFDNFFKTYGKYFSIQDIVLETPLHKIAKLRNKGFFFEIYQRLKKIGLINKELLLITNIDNETVFSYILEDIQANKEKLENNENFHNFINEYKSIYNKFSLKNQKLLFEFSSKIIFNIKHYKEDNFKDLFNNVSEFINTNKDIKVTQYIYYPFLSNINILNCLFNICSAKGNYDNLFILVSSVLARNEIKGKKYPISERCVLDHIKYVLRKMYLYKRKGENEYNYGLKLLNELLSKIIKNKDKSAIENIVKSSKRFKKGLLDNIEYNNNLDFDQKEKLYDLISQLTNVLSENFLDEKVSILCKFFKIYETINETNILELYKNNKDFHSFIDNYISYRKSLKLYFKLDGKYDSNFIEEKTSSFIKFLNDYNYNIFKSVYKIPDEKIKQIIKVLLIYESAAKNMDSNKNEEDVSYAPKNYKKMKKDFILSDKDITIYKLKKYLDHHNCEEFFVLFFSTQFDCIKNIDFKDITQMLTYKFIMNEEGEITGDISIFQKNLYLLKGRSYEEEYYGLMLKLSENLGNLNILLPKNCPDSKQIINAFTKKYYLKLIRNWDDDNFDYSEVINDINRYILLFTKLYYDCSKMFAVIMKELDPSFNTDVYIKAINIFKKNEYFLIDDLPEYLGEFYFLMILLFIKKKYDQECPNLSIFLFVSLYKKKYDDIIKYFNNCFKDNILGMNIFDDFMFEEFSYDVEKYKITDYLKKNNQLFCNTLKVIKSNFYCDYKKYIKLIREHSIGFAYFINMYNIDFKLTDFMEYKHVDENYTKYLFLHIDLYNKQYKYMIETLKISFFRIFDYPSESLNKAIFNKIIYIFGEIDLIGIEYFYNYDINNNVILNLYQLFIIIKQYNSKLYNLYYLVRDYRFKEQMALFLMRVLNYCHKLVSKEINKDKIEFIKEKIYEYINEYEPDSFLINNSLVEYTNKFNILLNKIKKLKKNNIDNEYSELKSFLYKCGKYTHERCFRNLICELLEVLFEYHPDNILTYLKDLSKVGKEGENEGEEEKNYPTYVDPFHLNLTLIKKNIEGYINHLHELKSIYSNKFPKIEGSIINHILKSKKYDLLFNQNITNHTNICNNIISSLLILENPCINKDAGKFIMNKVKTLYCGDDENFFIEFIKNTIKNEYIFDIILKIIQKKKDQYFFEQNKKLIVKSLYFYSERNGYYYIDNLLKYINKFLSLEEIKGFIYPSEEGNPSSYIQFLQDEFEIIEDKNQDEYNEEDNDYGDGNNKKSKKLLYSDENEKYLLFYSLKRRMVLNYETIGTLLNYCPKEKAITDLYPFLYYMSYKGLNIATKININPLSNSKNRSEIKSCNKFFYNFLLFIESLCKEADYISSLDETEKTLFYYCITINVLEITPMILFHHNIYNNNDSNNDINKRINDIEKNLKKYYSKIKDYTELELCMVFALYEIKGTPIIPIKKYMPDFYLKVENYAKKFKSKISDVCLKSSFDIKYNDYLINYIKNNTNNMIDLLHPYYNIVFIIEKEYGNILQLGNKIYIQKAVYNLIENPNIDSFINHSELYQEFCSKIGNYLDDDNDNFNIYKECIFSLRDFNRTSSIMFQDKNDDPYIRYLKYLKAVIKIIDSLNIGEDDDKKKKNNNIIKSDDLLILKDVLFQNINNRLSGMKNSIDLNQIKFYVINGLKNKGNNNNIIELLENWFNAYLNQSNIVKQMKDFSAKNTFSGYFNYLYLCCEIIIAWLNKIKEFTPYFFDKCHNKCRKYSNIKFVHNSKKDAEKNLKESLGRISSEIIKKINEIKSFEYEYDKKFIKYLNPIIRDVNLNLIISYYFDENEGDFVETCSGLKLMEFINKKLDSFDSFNLGLIEDKYYIYRKDYLQSLTLINEEINSNNIYKFYSEYLGCKTDDFSQIFKYFTPLLNPLYESNKNYIYNYIKDTAADPNQPNYQDSYNLIKGRLINFYMNYIYPCLCLNHSLEIYCNNYDYCFYSPEIKYKYYIDCNELIKAINNTKYHKDNNLNELFKIKAINYIINDDSLIHIYIDEIYKLKSDKKFYQNEKRENLNDTFVIKVEKGKKISNNDFKKLKEKIETNNSMKLDLIPCNKLKPSKDNDKIFRTNGNSHKKIKLKLKLKSRNDIPKKNIANNFSIYYSTFLNNRYKRDNIPIEGYSGYIPTYNNPLGKTKELILSQTFGNEFLKKDKLVENPLDNLGLNGNNKKIPEKKHFSIKQEEFVNVFDFIFTVKSIHRNEIVLYINNISNVLDNYSKPDTFIELLNSSFEQKTMLKLIGI